MAGKPKLDCAYTRDEINKMHGGGVQAFLPTKNGKVVCGCFKLDLNPDAPNEVLVGMGPQREMSARTCVLQGTPIPIFLKREVGEWEYVGHYKATKYLSREHKLMLQEERAQRKDVAGILFMKRFEEEVA